MRILLVGGTGMLGQSLRELAPSDWEVVAPDRSMLDVASLADSVLWANTYDAIVNAAAYTAVDKAESDAVNAWKLNADAPHDLAQIAALRDIPIIHYGTDFVFDGEKGAPYTEADIPHPLGEYGRSKRAGEQSVLRYPKGTVLRASWLFGPYRASFPKSIIRAHREGRPSRVVDDQMGTPTYAPDLARQTWNFLESGALPGLYHAAGAEGLTWHDFAQRILEGYLGESVDLPRITGAEWGAPAPRPRDSRLDSGKLLRAGIRPPRTLSEAIEDFVCILKGNSRLLD